MLSSQDVRERSDQQNELDFDLLAPDALRDPWKYLAAMREAEPIFWSDHQAAWMVTRFDDVCAAHLDPRLSAERIDIYLREISEEKAARYPTVIKYVPLLLSFRDAPAHTRVRRIMMKAFTRPIIESLRPFAQEIIADLLDECQQRAEFDYIKVAFELPSRMMMRIFSIPESSRTDFLAMASALAEVLGSPRTPDEAWVRFETSAERILKIVEGLIEDVRIEPRQDLLSALVHASDEDRKLDLDELFAAFLGIVAAGIDTTGWSSALFMQHIAQSPALLEIVRNQPSNVPKVVNELLRYPGFVKAQTRRCIEDFEWHGRQIRSGDFVYMLHLAANTDPRMFPEPYRIDPERTNGSRAIPFGYGAHHCIGHLLARTELEEFLTAWFDRFDVEILQQEFDFVPMYAFYAYKEMKIRVTRR